MDKNIDDEKLQDEVSSSEKDPAGDGDDRLDINKSVFQTNREMREQREKEAAEKRARLQAELEEREKKKREAYERRIREEKIELMRLKQGIIDESESIHEEHEEEPKLSIWKKIVNFFYHNKWWLGIGTVCACIAGFLIYSLVTKPNPDIVILVIADNEELGEMSELQDYIEDFTEDFNGNGKVQASVYYIPYSENSYKNYANGADSKLTTQLQSCDSVIVIGGSKLDEIMSPDAEAAFVDLEALYPDNPNVDGYKFMLKDTPFAQRIDLEPQYVTDDLYIAVRVPTKLLYSSKKEMEKTYDKDFPVFEKIVDDLSQ